MNRIDAVGIPDATVRSVAHPAHRSDLSDFETADKNTGPKHFEGGGTHLWRNQTPLPPLEGHQQQAVMYDPALAVMSVAPAKLQLTD